MAMLYNDYHATQIADTLWRAKVVGIDEKDPILFNTGWLSPIYCDNRRLQSYPNERSHVSSTLALAIRDTYPDVHIIGSVATGAITHGTLASDNRILSLPHVTIHKKAKDHGKKKLIDGVYEPGQNIVIFEDLFSTAESAVRAIQIAREAKLNVVGVIGLVTYDFPIADKNIAKEGCKIITLTNYGKIVQQGITRGDITEKQKIVLDTWYADPAAWKPMAA